MNIYKRRIAPLVVFFSWSETRLILVAAVVIGLLGGMGAVVFRWLIGGLRDIFFGGGENFLELVYSLPWWQRVAIPTVGGLVLSPFIKFFARETKGHGVPEVMEALVTHAGRISPRTMVTRALASAITIASGGSVGREGPIVQIGSAMGSTVGQFLKASESRMKTLVGCGAAAGMAATFNAPLGGALFAVEVILGDFGLAQVPPIIISSVSATVISRHFLGNYPAFMVPHTPLVSYYELLFYAALGLCAGVLAWLFVSVLYASEDIFERTRIPVWFKPAIGGFLVGIIAVWFPHIYGTGYETIELVLNNQLPLLILLALIFAKLLATSFTVGSGGSGGVFAPALFQGAMLGGSIGALLNLVVPELSAPYGTYALAGMGAMIAGTMHAPITVILVIFELTSDYTIILPIMTCSILSTLTAYKLLGGQSIYTRKLLRKGIDIYRGKDLNILRGMKVGDVMVQNPETVSESTPLSSLIRAALTNPHSSYIQVDSEGRMTGLISLQKILEAMRDENLRDILVAQDIASFEYPVISVEESLDEVIRKFGDSQIEEVPVVDPANTRVPIGVLRHNDVIQAYRNAVIRQDVGGFVAERLVQNQSFRDVDLLEGYRMIETEAPRQFFGKTIRELKISEIYNVQVILIQKTPKAVSTEETVRGQMHFVPRGNNVIEPGDRLVLVGKTDNLNRFPKP